MAIRTTSPYAGAEYREYFKRQFPVWMEVRAYDEPSIMGTVVEARALPHLLVDDEYGKLIRRHSIGCMVKVEDVRFIKELDLPAKFTKEVDEYLAAGVFDEYDYDDQGEKIEASKRIRRFTNWVMVHNGFPVYMKGVKPNHKNI